MTGRTPPATRPGQHEGPPGSGSGATGREGGRGSPAARPEERPEEHAGHLVRPYAVTGGRTRPRLAGLTLITLVRTRDTEVDLRRLEPEPAAILRLCRPQPLAVAEVAAQMDLPVSVVKVLLADLLDNAMILTRAPAAAGQGPDVGVLQAVIDGIRRL